MKIRITGDFLERFVNAQFSQKEEKAADDHALDFMKRQGYDPTRAVSALNKLAQLGSDHTDIDFLLNSPIL